MNNAPGTPWRPPPSGYYAPPPPAQPRANALAIVTAFVGILLVIALAVTVIVLLSQPPAPVAPCEQGVPCAPQSSLRPVADATPRPSLPRPTLSASPSADGTPVSTGRPSPAPTPMQPPGSPAGSPFVPPTPISDAPPVVHGELWQDAAMGYSFEYHGDDWTLGDVGDDATALNGVFFDAQIVVTAASASVSAAQMIERQLVFADRFVLGRAPDTDSYDALLGPSIGYVSGEGGVYAGTLVSRDGTPIGPVGVTVLASTNGRMTIGVLVICGQPDLRLGSDTHQHIVRSSADLILKSFDWDTTS